MSVMSRNPRVVRMYSSVASSSSRSTMPLMHWSYQAKSAVLSSGVEGVLSDSSGSTGRTLGANARNPSLRLVVSGRRAALAVAVRWRSGVLPLSRSMYTVTGLWVWLLLDTVTPLCAGCELTEVERGRVEGRGGVCATGRRRVRREVTRWGVLLARGAGRPAPLWVGCRLVVGRL